MLTTATAERDIYAARRWVTLAASTLPSLCCGFFYAWSVLVKPMTDLYHWSPGNMALAFTLIVGPPTLLLVAGASSAQGMVIGKVGWDMLSDRFGRDPVIITILALAALTALGLVLAVFNTWLGRRKAATS